MSENTETKQTVLTIDGVEYILEQMSDKQRMLVEHVADLDRKLHSSKFSLDQLQVGRDAFFSLLKQELSADAEPSVADVPVK